MKKGIKILIGIIIFVILLVVTYIVLVVKEILPNPLLDTRDLYCYKDSSNFTIDDKIEEKKIFKFDSKAIIISYEEKTIYTFASEEYAKEQYEYAKEQKTDNADLNKNVLTISRTFLMKENEGYYGKTKEEIKKIYGDEFSYDCE